VHRRCVNAIANAVESLTPIANPGRRQACFGRSDTSQHSDQTGEGGCSRVDQEELVEAEVDAVGRTRAFRARAAAPRAGSSHRRRTGRALAWVAVSRSHDLRARLLEHRLVVRVVPLDELLDDAEEPLPLPLLHLLGRKLIWAAGRVVDDRGEEHSSARCQRPPRPPEVERRQMPVPDRLLACRLAIDREQAERLPVGCANSVASANAGSS
jgi:hypothetical protein